MAPFSHHTLEHTSLEILASAFFLIPGEALGMNYCDLLMGSKTSLRFSVKTSLILVETGWQEKGADDICQNQSTWEIEQLSREWYSVEHQKSEVWSECKIWLLSREIHNIVYTLGNACADVWDFGHLCHQVFAWNSDENWLASFCQLEGQLAFTFQNFKLLRQNNFRDSPPPCK